MTSPDPVKVGRDTIFADISELTGMPFPNLLYRRLGEDPRRLEDCWGRVRPGLARIGHTALRRLMLDGIDSADAHAPAARGPEGKISNARPASGTSPINPGQAATLLRILSPYDSGNSCNAVVVALLRGGAPGDSSSPLLSTVASTGDALPTEMVTAPLPPMLEVDDMGTEARNSVLRLARLIEPGGRAVPSLFRHIGHDTALLDWIESVVTDAAESGALNRCEDSVRAVAARTAAHWPEPVQPLDDDQVRKLLQPFETMIPRMLATSTVLRAALSSQLP
ncbi:hypothetical protein [Arthrobacter sp. H41]|uniref:hypothetical protein n=1 Tax=Arthrobacter sp. H41 TaxID=1312978 RepID=UPI000478BC6D|nr:hypothetical protein [Arthrobacter sp. H41]